MVLVKSIVQVIVFFPKRYTRHLFSTDFHKMLTFCIWQFHNSNTLDSVSKSIRGAVLTTVRERSVKFRSKRHSRATGKATIHVKTFLNFISDIDIF